jgi:hypothetical protein
MSCGIGPPTISFIQNGGGVIMTTGGGTVGCGTTIRSTTLNVKCSTTNNRMSNTVDPMIESPPCTYTVNQN